MAEQQPLFRLFQINRYSFSNYHRGANGRSPVHYFGYLLNGYATFESEDGAFEVHTDEMVYIPEGVVYHSHWYGDPTVSFYSIPFLYYPFANVQMPLQKVLLPRAFRSELDAMFRDFSQGDSHVYHAFGAFCSLYGQLLPLLKHKEAPQRPQRVQAAVTHLDSTDEPCTAAQLAALCGMGESRFFALFREEMGCTPIEYKNRVRIRRACELLIRDDRTIEEIAWQLKFSSPAYFRRVFSQITGYTPGQYRTMRSL